jgi:hypothetical protein
LGRSNTLFEQEYIDQGGYQAFLSKPKSYVA